MATKKEPKTKTPAEEVVIETPSEVVKEAEHQDVTEAAAIAGVSPELLTELDEVAVDTDETTAGKTSKLKQGRRALVKKMQVHDNDTGSTEVQIALLTGKIVDLVKHLKDHPKDHDSRQGLLKMVGRRRRLLRFLQNGDPATYQSLIADLKLRK